MALGAVMASPAVRRRRAVASVLSRLSLLEHGAQFRNQFGYLELDALADELEFLALEVRSIVPALLAVAA